MLALPFIEAPTGETPIELESLEVDVRVTGLYAETTQTLAFRNPNPRDLEGTLSFPLPEAAAVCGYALDIEGVLVDGVLVPKQKARRILEAEVRKGVDPGLVEHVQGNIFRTRVYPLPAMGTRRVRVTYVSELSVDDASAYYHLPLSHAAGLPGIPVLADVLSPVDPRVSAALENRQGRWVGQTVLRQTDSFDLTLPNLPPAFSLVEETKAGEAFFAVSLATPPVPTSRFTPTRLGVVWDASGSRGDLGAEFHLLRLLSAQWPEASCSLYVVRDRIEAKREFPSLSALADEVEKEPCDGATDLSGLDFSDPVDAWLFFSDGLHTSPTQRPKPAGIPIFTISSGAAADHNWLSHLSEISQGTAVNLGRSKVEEAVERFTTRPSSSYQPQWKGGEDVHLARSTGRIQLLGRLTQGSMRLNLPNGEVLEVDRTQARPGRLLARAWAAREVARLALGADNGERILGLGRRYHLVTPGSSLLVLESLEQYLEYDLEPPASQRALQEAFWQHRRQQESHEHTARQFRLDRVADLWRARVDWWERDFRSKWPCPSQENADPELDTVRPSLAAPLARRRSPDQEEPEVLASMLFDEDDLFNIPGEEAVMSDISEGGLLFSVDGGSGPFAAMSDTGGLSEGETPHNSSTAASISIQAWDPDTPYLDELRTANDPYSKYLQLRQEYSNSPSFFLDCGDHLLRAGHIELGLRVLSNLTELALEDPALMRMHAWRLQEAERLDLSIPILEEVLRLRPDEPQSHRDLGLAYGLRFEKNGRPEDAERAVDLLYTVVCQTWDRFPEIELIALMELNRTLEFAKRLGHDLDSRIDSRLRKTLDLDLRISLSWDADLTDVDLHVHEPTGEQASYRHRDTTIGGLVSWDVRDGYGPEEYVLRRAYPGEYKVLAHYYGSHQQTLTGSCTVIVTVFTNYARPNEQRQTLMLRLDKPSNEVLVGRVEIGQVASTPS